MPRWPLPRKSAAAGRKLPGQIRIHTSSHSEDFLFRFNVNGLRLCKAAPPKMKSAIVRLAVEQDGTGVSTVGPPLELYNALRGLVELPGQQQPPARETKPGFSFRQTSW